MVQKVLVFCFVLFTAATALQDSAVVEAKIFPVACSEDALIEAINQANSEGGSNTLELAEGCTYTIDQVHNAGTDGDNGLPQITSDIAVNGNNAVIRRDDGAPKFRFFQVTDEGALELEKVTLRNGNVDTGGHGGAVSVSAGALTLTGCALEENYAGCGGALTCDSGTVTMTDTVFTGNTGDA